MKDASGARVRRLLDTLFAVAFCTLIAVTSSFVAKTVLSTTRDQLAKKFPCKEMFVEMNGLVHRLAGRRFCNTVYRTPGGMLLSEAPGVRRDFKRDVDEIVRFASWLSEQNAVYVYVQAPAKIDINGEMLPSALANHCNENADIFLSGLAARGVALVDLRGMLTATEADVAANFYMTDHHWNNDAVFRVFGHLVPQLAKACGRDPSPAESVVSTDAWRRVVWGGCFMGTKARRTGRLFGGLDDLVVYVPTFPTEMSMDIPAKGVSRSGDFRSTVMWRSGKVRESKGDEFRTDAYSLLYIGGVYGTVLHSNRRAPFDLRLMIVGDSYARPLEAFLSTAFSEVLALDQRRLRPGESVVGFARDFRPDVVLQLCNPICLGCDDGTLPVFFEYGEY